MPSSFERLGRLLISGETFYLIGNSRLYRWRVGEDRWTDLGLAVSGGEELAVSGRIVYAARQDGRLLRSVDEGDTWTDVSQRLPNWNLQSKPNYKQLTYELYFVDETIYAESWGLLRNESNTYYRRTANRVYRSTDGGETWESVVNPGGGFDMRFVHDSTLYGTNSDAIFRLTRGSDSWELVVPTQYSVRSLAFVDMTLYARTYREGIFRFSLDE